MLKETVPILTCAAVRELEDVLFAGEEAREWPAMQRAGEAVAAGILGDFRELGSFPPAGRILVLAGRGHNGGDALLAARTLLGRFPAATADVWFAFGTRGLRPLAARAWQGLVQAAPGRVATLPDGPAARRTYDVGIDGVFGFTFRPPAEPWMAALLERFNVQPVRLRAAVDLPSAGIVRADFTYATGSVKAPVVDVPEAGRVRYLDLGFFRGGEPGNDRVLTPRVLDALAALRDARTDKRTYGHVCVVGGSRRFPGAVLMTVLAALRSGAGLVTAFVPESVAAAFAARAPEAMWVGWPETPAGGLALEGEHLLRGPLERATALVVGPGLGREPETLALAAALVRNSTVPLVLDADALQPDLVRAGTARRILTPHAGEFARMAGETGLREFAGASGATVILKGPVTRVADGPTVYHSFDGGPVLARGGSGDLLAGLVGGLLAQTPAEPGKAAVRGVVWHGRAADRLARAHGPVAVSVTQLLDFLPAVLRDPGDAAGSGVPGA